jgi:hypothetical protein
VRWRAAGGFAAAALLLAGCAAGASAQTRVDATPDQVVGTWHSSAGGTITFRSDRTLTASDLLNQLFDAQHRPGGRHSGAGNWELTARLDDPKGPRDRLSVEFAANPQHPNGYAGEMRLERADGHGLLLVFFVAAPDLHGRYEFGRDS